MADNTISTPEDLKKFEKSVGKSIKTPEIPNKEAAVESEKSSNLDTPSKETEKEKEKSSKVDFNKVKNSITGALDAYGNLIKKSSEETELPEERKKLDEVLENIKLVSKAVGSILSVTEPLMPDTLKVVSKVIRLAIASFDEVNSSRIEAVKDLGKSIADLVTGSFEEKLNTITGAISTVSSVMEGVNKPKEKNEKSPSQEAQKLVESMQSKTVVSNNSKITSPVTSVAVLKMDKGAALGA